MASHHEEAPASEWVHIQTMMTHARIIFHTTLSVLLGRTQSPNMSQQYYEQHYNALRLHLPHYWPLKEQFLVVDGQKLHFHKKTPRNCFGAHINNNARTCVAAMEYLLAASELSTKSGGTSYWCCKSKHAMVGQRLWLPEQHPGNLHSPLKTVCTPDHGNASMIV